MARIAALALLALAVLLNGAIDAQDKKRSGTLTGEIKSKKDSPNGKNVILEVLAPGEEKARPYRVQYDPAIKAPIATVLAAVRAANVGDRVQLEWVDTGEGLAIKTFQVLKKTEKKDDKK